MTTSGPHTSNEALLTPAERVRLHSRAYNYLMASSLGSLCVTGLTLAGLIRYDNPSIEAPVVDIPIAASTTIVGFSVAVAFYNAAARHNRAIFALRDREQGRLET